MMLGINFLVIMIVMALVVPILVVVLFSRHDAKVRKEEQWKKDYDERQKCLEKKHEEEQQKQAEEDAQWPRKREAQNIKENLEKMGLGDMLVHAVGVKEDKINFPYQSVWNIDSGIIRDQPELGKWAFSLFTEDVVLTENAIPISEVIKQGGEGYLSIMIFNKEKTMRLGIINGNGVFDYTAAPDFRTWLVFLLATTEKRANLEANEIIKIQKLVELKEKLENTPATRQLAHLRQHWLKADNPYNDDYQWLLE